MQHINPTTKFVVALFHHSPFNSGPHREDETGLRSTFVPLFERYRVDIVFSGHDHIYERSLVNDVYYVGTGGGGAPLYNRTKTNIYGQVFVKAHHFCRFHIAHDHLVLDVFDIDLNSIDHLTIKEKR